VPVLPSACPLDCPDHCTLDVSVEEGRVTRVEPRAENPITDGFICGKVRRIGRHLHGEDRLRYPGIREGRKGEGRFRRASWDEALDLIAGKFATIRATSGGEAILPYYYGGSNGALTQDATDASLFRRLGSTRILRTLCAAATGRATMGLYGKMPGVSYPDFEKAAMIIVWGQNPSASSIHLVPIIRRAVENGTRLVVVDPRSTPLAKLAHRHLAPRPGTDLPLALAIARWLFVNGRADEAFLAAHATGVESFRERAMRWTPEEAARVTGIPAADIEATAAEYADATPALIRCGWGLERNRNGGSAVASVIALPTVAGKFGVRGGGYTLSNSPAWKLGATVSDPENSDRIINMNDLGEALLTLDAPRIEALFVYNANPLMTVPDQNKVRAGMEREDLFTVVFDAVMTDSARYADVVLPATTFLEHTELSRGYGPMSLQLGTPVVAPEGEARPNYQVFHDLVVRCGLARPGDTGDPVALSKRSLAGLGFTAMGIGNGTGNGTGRGNGNPADTGHAAPDLLDVITAHRVVAPDTGPNPIQFIDIFPRTPDRKVHLVPPDLDAEAPGGLYHFQGDPGTERYPLALISPALPTTISSTFAQLIPGHVPVDIHADDAARRGITTGDSVRIHNELGEVFTTARISADVRPGVVSLPKGLWARHTANGATANALAPATHSDIGGNACFNDARVEIERA
jgi:anaerobic selenocysteine-containing dehydrogenase